MLNEKRELQNHETNNNTPKAPFFPRATIQPKLSINTPGDAYEQEADAMADKVMRMQIPASQDSFFKPALSSIQRKCKGCEDEDKKLHRKESNGSEMHGSNELDSYVSTLSSSGQPLPESSRQFFEPRFGQDFSNVRIHTDSVAAKSAQSINALAYTTGNNIVFNNGQYSPGSESGNRLMAHELTHVVQQGGSIQMPATPALSTNSIQTKTSNNFKKKQENTPLNSKDEFTLSKIQGFAMPELIKELSKPEYEPALLNEAVGQKVGGIRLIIAMRVVSAKKENTDESTKRFYAINRDTLESWKKNTDQILYILAFLPPLDPCYYKGKADKHTEIHLMLDPGFSNSAIRVYEGNPNGYSTKEYTNVITGPATLKLAKSNHWCRMYPIDNKQPISHKGLINFANYSGDIGFHSNYHKHNGKIEKIPHEQSHGCARLHDLGPDSVKDGDSKDFFNKVNKGDCVRLLLNKWVDPTFKQCKQ